MVQLRWIRGYVRILVQGFGNERFINLCGRRGICLWNIVREQDRIAMNLLVRDYFRIRPLVRKTRTRVTISGRYGFPFFMQRVWRRKAFTAGFCCAVLFWILMNFFIWDIQVAGNYSITTDHFQHFLSQEGVVAGMTRESLDIEQLEKQIRRTFPQVTWASARLEGIRLLIEIKENDVMMEPEVVPEETGRDIVAPKSGKILAIIVRKGIPKCKIGDTVEEGQLLVSGKVPVMNDDGTVRYEMLVDASATYEMEHRIYYEDHLPYSYVEKQYTGRSKEVPYCRVGEKSYALPVKIPFLAYDTISTEEKRPVMFEKLSIPLVIGSKQILEYANVECEYDLQEACQLLEEKYRVFLQELEDRGLQIIAKDGKMDSDECSWVYSAQLVVRQIFSEENSGELQQTLASTEQ